MNTSDTKNKRRTIMTVTVIVCAALALPSPAPAAYALSGRSINELNGFEDSLAEVNLFTKDLIKKRGAAKPEEKLWVISDFMGDPENGFSYGGGNPSRLGVDFFKTRKGVCSDFSMLYAVMARAAGLKARYMDSVKREHAIASFRLDGKWRYYDVTNRTAWSPNKSFDCILNEWDMYIDGDQYKAAFLSKTGALYEKDYSDNSGYTDKIYGYIISTSTMKMTGYKSDDYEASESFDFGNLDYIKTNARPSVKIKPGPGSLKLAVKKPEQLNRHIAYYEAAYKLSAKKKWPKPKRYRYSPKRSITLKGLKRGKKYDVRIRAVKSIGGTAYRCAWTKKTCRTK